MEMDPEEREALREIARKARTKLALPEGSSTQGREYTLSEDGHVKSLYIQARSIGAFPECLGKLVHLRS